MVGPNSPLACSAKGNKPMGEVGFGFPLGVGNPGWGEIPPQGVPGTVDKKAHIEALAVGWPEPFSLEDPELLWPVDSICKNLGYALNQKRPGHQGFLTTSLLFYKGGPTVIWCYNSGFPQRTMSPHLLASTGTRPGSKRKSSVSF